VAGHFADGVFWAAPDLLIKMMNGCGDRWTLARVAVMLCETKEALMAVMRWVVGALMVLMAAGVGGAAEWEPVGLSGGGGMFHPVISPLDSKTAILHCDMSDVFLTHDGGTTWRMIHTAELRSNTRCRAAFHPTDGKVIYSPSGNSTIKASIGRNWRSLMTVWTGRSASIRGSLS
jgi:photosystem II stability/assembly factor-like uncharacterized protein